MSNNPLITRATDANFEQEVLRADRPVLVKFGARWCTPCKALKPVVDMLATEYEGALKVMEMDVDEQSATPARYNIRGIPMLCLFKDGALVDQLAGLVPKTAIYNMLRKAGVKPAQVIAENNTER